jgi:hypothetical protein
MIPAKKDLEVQAVFLEEQMEPRLDEAKAWRKRAVFFVDAAPTSFWHPSWAFCGRWSG